MSNGRGGAIRGPGGARMGGFRTPSSRVVVPRVEGQEKRDVGEIAQPWTTIAGTSATAEVTQPKPDQVDVRDIYGMLVLVEVLGITNCTLSLQSGMGQEGPWTSLASYTATTKTALSLSADAESYLLTGYLRWKVAASGANWKTCFRLEAFPTG